MSEKCVCHVDKCPKAAEARRLASVMQSRAKLIAEAVLSSKRLKLDEETLAAMWEAGYRTALDDIAHLPPCANATGSETAS